MFAFGLEGLKDLHNKIDNLTMPEILREMEEIERYATEMSP